MISEIPGLTAIADERPCAEDGCGVIREFGIDGIATCEAATNITRIALVEGVDGIRVSRPATESWCRRGELAGEVWIGELNGNTWQLRYTDRNTFRLSIIAP